MRVCAWKRGTVIDQKHDGIRPQPCDRKRIRDLLWDPQREQPLFGRERPAAPGLRLPGGKGEKNLTEVCEYLAKESEKAGADALELNFSCPNMTTNNTGSSVGQIPELVEEYTRAVVKAVKIPVIAKLTPNVATMSEVA